MLQYINNYTVSLDIIWFLVWFDITELIARQPALFDSWTNLNVNWRRENLPTSFSLFLPVWMNLSLQWNVFLRNWEFKITN